MPNLSIQNFLPQAIRYLQEAQPDGIPDWHADQTFEVTPLAQGEYNLNFLVQQGKPNGCCGLIPGPRSGFPTLSRSLTNFRPSCCWRSLTLPLNPTLWMPA